MPETPMEDSAEKNVMKVFVPLFLEVVEESYFFWHLYSDTAAAFNTAIHNWDLFCRFRRSCALVLVVTSDVILQMARIHIRRYSEMNPDAGTILLSDASSWFSMTPSRTGRLPFTDSSAEPGASS